MRSAPGSSPRRSRPTWGAQYPFEDRASFLRERLGADHADGLLACLSSLRAIRRASVGLLNDGKPLVLRTILEATGYGRTKLYGRLDDLAAIRFVRRENHGRGGVVIELLAPSPQEIEAGCDEILGRRKRSRKAPRQDAPAEAPQASEPPPEPREIVRPRGRFPAPKSSGVCTPPSKEIVRTARTIPGSAYVDARAENLEPEESKNPSPPYTVPNTRQGTATGLHVLALSGEAIGGAGEFFASRKEPPTPTPAGNDHEAKIREKLAEIRHELAEAERRRRAELVAWDHENPEPYHGPHRTAPELVAALLALKLPEAEIHTLRGFAPEIEAKHARGLAAALDSEPLPSDPQERTRELVERLSEWAGVPRGEVARRATEHGAWIVRRGGIEAPHRERLGALGASERALGERLRRIAQAKAAEDAKRDEDAKKAQAIGKAPRDEKGATLWNAVAEMLARGKPREDVIREALAARDRAADDPPRDWVGVLVKRLERSADFAAAARAREESERLEAVAVAQGKSPETDAGRLATALFVSAVEHGPGAPLSPAPERELASLGGW